MPCIPCIYDSISYKNINPLKNQDESSVRYEIQEHMNKCSHNYPHFPKNQVCITFLQIYISLSLKKFLSITVFDTDRSSMKFSLVISKTHLPPFEIEG